MKLKYKYFAIDFDGTIVYDAYPGIGDLIPGAKETMQRIKECQGKIILWTCRTHQAREDAKKFLDDNEIPYDKFNEPFEENINQYGGDHSRKIFADVYIDDRAFPFCGKSIDWIDVQHMIFSYEFQDWKVNDTIECLKDCMNNFKKGERFKINSIDHNIDWISFGPVGTTISYVAEKFKKVE